MLSESENPEYQIEPELEVLELFPDTPRSGVDLGLLVIFLSLILAEATIHGTRTSRITNHL
jgi:hypothetical protein